MAVYLLTESLLTPMLLHVTLDFVNGLTLYRVRARPAFTKAPPRR